MDDENLDVIGCYRILGDNVNLNVVDFNNIASDFENLTKEYTINDQTYIVSRNNEGATVINLKKEIKAQKNNK